MIRRCRGLALILGALLVALPAAADEAGPFDVAVPGLPGKTWIDLLTQIFPDIAATPRGYAEASEVIDLRSIGAGDESWVRCGDKIGFYTRDGRPVRLAGRDYLIVTVLLEDDCVGPLALFDDAGELVDAVNVKGDQHVSFSDDYVRPLGPNGALVIASLWHDNSSMSYDISSLLLATPAGFSTIGNVLALGSRMCGEDGKNGELLLEESKIRVVPNGDPLARIDAAVTRSLQRLDADDCKTKIGHEVKTTFDGYWRWNVSKRAYEAHTREIDLLDKWNEKHF
jgi:hypothetical protein